MMGGVFMLAALTIYIGQLIASKYMIGVGSMIAGVTDCACMALALSIAGKWEKNGVTAFNLSQTMTICCSGLLIAFFEI